MSAHTFDVYDSKNKVRFLGTLKVNHYIHGYSFKLAVQPRMSYRDYRNEPPERMEVNFNTVLFDLVERSKSTAKETGRYTRQIVTDEWTVLETDAKLEDLMRLDGFRLPGENQPLASERRRMAERFSDY
jgi:hypothetical protein